MFLEYTLQQDAKKQGKHTSWENKRLPKYLSFLCFELLTKTLKCKEITLHGETIKLKKKKKKILCVFNLVTYKIQDAFKVYYRGNEIKH